MKKSLFLLFIISFASLKAELLLIRKDRETFLYEYTDEEKRKELDEIYKNILMKYQWPMVTMYYPLFSEEEREEFDKALTQENGVKSFINKKLEKEHPNYQVIEVPTTFFELALLRTYMEQMLEVRNSKIKKSYINPAEFGKKIKGEIENNILKAQEEWVSAQKKDYWINIAKFRQKIYEEFNFGQEQIKLYYRTVENILSGIFTKNKSEEYHKCMFEKFDENTGEFTLKEGVENSILERISNEEFLRAFLKDTVISVERLSESKKKDKSTLNPVDFRESPVNYREFLYKFYINPEDHYKLLAAGIQRDWEASQANEVLLYRGTQGFILGDYLFDFPSNKDEISKDADHLHEYYPRLFFRQRYKNTRLSTKLGDLEKDESFTPISLSFGNSLLAGTINEAGDKKGARALDFIKKNLSGYSLNIPLLEYLQSLQKNLWPSRYLYISGLSVINAFLAQGEFFHHRTKISFKKEFSKIENSDETKTVQGLFSLDKSHYEEILHQDWQKKIGLLTLTNEDWPSVSSAIGHILVNYLKAFPDNPERDKQQKEAIENLSLFEFEKTALMKFAPTLKEIHKMRQAGEKPQEKDNPNSEGAEGFVHKEDLIQPSKIKKSSAEG